MTSPYRDPVYNGQPMSRVSAMVASEDLSFIRAYVPDRGMQEFVIGSLFHAFVNELKKQNLPLPHQHADYIILKNTFTETIRRLTFSSVDGSRAKHNVGRRA